MDLSHYKEPKPFYWRRIFWTLIRLTLFRCIPGIPLRFVRNAILKMFGANIPWGTLIYESCKIWAPWNLTIGKYSCVGPNVELYNKAPIVIGNNVVVSQGAKLYTASHDIYDKKFSLITAPVHIEDKAWIASFAYVGMGVTIGEGAVVGATASVYKDVEPWTVVGGNPATVIKRRVSTSQGSRVRRRSVVHPRLRSSANQRVDSTNSYKTRNISVIILTYNEELHIERAISNAKRFAKEVFVVDSFSTDNTIEIAERNGARVYKHEFRYQADQFNWALDNLPIGTEWIFRLDADEYLTDALIDEIKDTLTKANKDDGINGYTAPRLMMFLGRYIKHGIVPMIMLRLFRYRFGRVEDKMMDEHVMLSEGTVGELKNPFFDDNHNGLTWWTQKHNGYSTREALDLLATEYGIGTNNDVANTGEHSAYVRKMKLKYVRLPLFWRAFAFFVYRYFFRLGFLDGKEGFLWHFLQGFWYRSLADAKVYEIKKSCSFDKEKIKEYVLDRISKNPVA